MDYDFSAPGKVDKYSERLKTLGAAMYGAMAIERADGQARADFASSNLVSFGAPVLLLLPLPQIHEGSAVERCGHVAANHHAARA